LLAERGFRTVQVPSVSVGIDKRIFVRDSVPRRHASRTNPGIGPVVSIAEVELASIR
jgi:hypothetical protein